MTSRGGSSEPVCPGCRRPYLDEKKEGDRWVCTCGRFTWPEQRVEGRVLSHPDLCSCAIPCRSCGHESEQHAGSMWYGTGPRRCRVDGCNCKGCYIGSTPARCKERPYV